MNRGKFIICMVSVLGLGIGGDYRSVEAQNSQNNNGSASYETLWSSKLPPQNTCGRTNASHHQIIGGNPAELGAWPWIAALGYQNIFFPTSKHQWLCGGTLISDRYVLTAAHCTGRVGTYKDFELAVVRLGDLNLDSKVIDGSEPIDIAISNVIPHKEFNEGKLTNDIALLKLEKSVGFNQFIQPICLPILPNHRNQTFVNKDLIVAGWGSTIFGGPSTTALMEVQIPVVDNSECKRSYANYNIAVDDKHLCAGKPGKTTCKGDSGGPLMWPNDAQYYVVGVVSFAIKCDVEGYPTVYARVTSYVEWIVDKMNEN